MPPAFTLSQDQTLKFISPPSSQNQTANLKGLTKLQTPTPKAKAYHPQPTSKARPKPHPNASRASHPRSITQPLKDQTQTKSKTQQSSTTQTRAIPTPLSSRKPDAILNQHRRALRPWRPPIIVQRGAVCSETCLAGQAPRRSFLRRPSLRRLFREASASGGGFYVRPPPLSNGFHRKIARPSKIVRRPAPALLHRP